MNSTAMSTNSDLRDFLMLPYAELEELNLRAKQQRQERVPLHALQEQRLEVSGRRAADQGADRALQRSRRPASHARLRQEVLAQVPRQSDVRRFVDPRLYAAARERFALVARLERLLLGAGGHLRRPARCWSSATSSTATAKPFAGDIRGTLKKFANECYTKEGYTLNAANEIEGFLFKGLDAERRYHETGKFEYVNTGGYYHSLAGRPAARLHRYGRRSAARDGLPEREGPPGGRAVAVRDQLQLRRSRRSGRSDPALQADLPPSRDEARHDRELLAQAGRRRQRQRHAHQRLGQQERQEPLLGSEGIRAAQQPSAGSSSTASSRTETTSA